MTTSTFLIDVYSQDALNVYVMISGSSNEIIFAGSAADLPMLFFQENGILQDHYMQPSS